jgi:predicted dehydrogenase
MGAGSVTVGISGCGAAAALYHAPALKLLEAERTLRVIGLFDPDPREMAAVGARFPSAARHGSFDALLAAQPDLVIVASPPAHHAEQAAAALRAGCAVLCEKPLATRLGDAKALVKLARESGRILAAGMIRRYLPATRFIAQALRAGTIGTPRRFSAFEGGPFDWPVRSPAYFTRASSGGGVLMDIGIHALDLLGWWFGPCTALSYEDDAMGGVEADCRVRLSCGEVHGELRLSRTWRRPNRYEILGTAGRIAWLVDDPERIEIGVGNSSCRLDGVLRDGARPAANFHQSMVEQIRAVCLAVSGEPSEFVSGADGLSALELVERCYGERRPMRMGWLGAEELRAAERLGGAGL